MSSFQVGWYRFIPFIGFHHFMMIFLAISIILLSILLAGCTSESLNGIYLVSWSYAASSSAMDSVDDKNPSMESVFSALASNGTALEVRVGYMGMCVRAADQRICSKNPDTLAAFAGRLASEDEVGDPLRIIAAADKFQEEVVFVALLFVSIAFAFFAILLLTTFPVWRESTDGDGSEREVPPFPSRKVTMVTAVFSAISSVLCLLSSLWQHLSSSAASTLAQFFTYSAVTCRVGAGAMVLGWLSTFLLLLASLGLITTVASIGVLTELIVSESGGSSGQ